MAINITITNSLNHFFLAAGCLAFTNNYTFLGLILPKSLTLLDTVSQYLPGGKSSGNSKSLKLHVPHSVYSFSCFYLLLGAYL